MVDIPDVTEGDRVEITARPVDHSEDGTEYYPQDDPVSDTAVVVDDEGASSPVVEFDEAEWESQTDEPTPYAQLVSRNDGEMRCVHPDSEYSYSAMTCAVLDDIAVVEDKDA